MSIWNCKNKFWCVCKIDWCLVIKRNEILIHATTWISIKVIVLSEIILRNGDMYWMSLLIKIPRKCRLICNDRKQVSVCLGMISSVQFSSVAHLCLNLCDPMDCSMPAFSAHHQLLEPTQTHVHWVSGAIQPSHPLSSPSPPTFNLSQLQGLFKWISSSHQVAKVLEFQLQHQSFQWILRIDFL